RVPADEAPHDPEQPRARERDAWEIEPTGRAPALYETPQGKRDEDEADRHVEPEDPVPGDPLDDRAADERPEGNSQSPDTAPGAEREPTLRRGHGRAEQREGEGHHDRAAETLHGTGDVQRLHARRERGGARTEGEDTKPEGEHPPSAEAVAERSTGQEQHRERERVGVHRPFELLERRAEIGPEHREAGRRD